MPHRALASQRPLVTTRGLHREDPIPLHARIREELRERIARGDLCHHQRLPSETELMQHYGVSRITVRQAVQALEHQGLVIKVPGKGAFVAPPKPYQQLGELQGLAEAMRRKGHEIHNQVLAIERQSATPEHARALGLPDGAALVVGNENLKVAVAQVANARAVLGASQAAQSPTLSANASASRSDTGTVTSTRQPQNAFSAGLSANWEWDLWGRLAEATRANKARFEASEADLAAARLSAQASLTQAYFSLRTAEIQGAILSRSVAAYERSLALTQARLDAGVASPSDVLQAQTQLKTAQVQAVDVETRRAQYEHAIAALLGQPPSALSLPRAEALQALPLAPAVPAFVPSTLLKRRPDVAAAERRVTAAYAAIGVADAAFFPSLTLSASGGVRSSAVDDLLRAPTLFWSLGPALAQKLFDGGALKAASAQARASAEQAAATYRQTVLVALQETEDNLLLADRIDTQATLQQEALRHAQRNLDITQEQYRVGTVSYLNVVTAQNTALSAERSLLDLRLKQLLATVRLLKDTTAP